MDQSACCYAWRYQKHVYTPDRRNWQNDAEFRVFRLATLSTWRNFCRLTFKNTLCQNERKFRNRVYIFNENSRTSWRWRDSGAPPHQLLVKHPPPGNDSLFIQWLKGQLKRRDKLISITRFWSPENSFEGIFEKFVFVFEIWVVEIFVFTDSEDFRERTG